MEIDLMSSQPDDIHIVPDIEKELARLWEQQKEKNQVKACLFNLIIYAQDQSRNDYLRDISRIIATRFPCRIIFILGNPLSNDSHLHVIVSQEMVSDGELTIACDLINIYVSKEYLDRVPFLVIPHLVPDLPVNLLWAQDPTLEKEVLPFIAPYANRLIFDVDSTDNLKDFVKRIQNYSLKDYELIDMNWIMISGWREVIRETFYTEERIADLNRATRITITRHIEKSQDWHEKAIQAIYLQGWLAAQQGWRFQRKEVEDQKIKLQYHTGQNIVEIELVGQIMAEGLLPGTTHFSGNHDSYRSFL